MPGLVPLFEAVAHYLAPREPWREFSAAFAAAAHSAAPGTVDDAGGWIEAALKGVPNDALLAAVRAALRSLTWRQNPNYTDPAFLAAYTYCELLGPSGHASNVELSAGFLCLKPHTYYPPHAHPAHEVYHLLSGTSSWQRGAEPWIERRAGARIEHPPGVSHAMRSSSQPMLALYLWRGDLGVAARLIDQ